MKLSMEEVMALSEEERHIRALSEADATRMATLVLAGWKFRLLAGWQFRADGVCRWVAEFPRPMMRYSTWQHIDLLSTVDEAWRLHISRREET